ncbi:MAG: thiol reductant ABC exporter subunit CydD [Coriobacteriales bacterium]|nr:thiol reductant ABC exporter subunit CydD [Coriobacteriales bacterium]
MGPFDKNILQLPGAKRALVALMVCSLLTAALIAGQALGLARALTLLWNGAGVSAIVTPLLVFVACYVGRQLVALMRSRLMDTFSRRASSTLREQLLERSFEAGPTFAHEHGSAALASSVVDGIDKVRNYLDLTLPKLADLILIPLLLVVLIFVLDWVSGIICLIMLPAIVLFMIILGSNAKEAAAKRHAQFNRMKNHFMDTLRGLPTLKVLGRSQAYGDRVFKVSERFRELSLETIRTATLSSLFMDLFRTFALAAVAIMLGFRLMSGDIALQPALAVLILVPEYFVPIRRFSMDFHASLDGRNNLASITKMLDPQAGLSEEADPALSGRGPLTRISFEPPPLRADGDPASPPLRCTATDASLEYRSATGTRQALTGVSFDVAGPQLVAIVGASGAGKTSLLQLLAGFTAPSSGEISWSVGPERICYIPQRPHIFNASLRENIAFYAPDASDEQVLDAAERAGLGALIRQLPQGLDTLCGEGGRGFSGGEAHRIALARALVDERRCIWLLDEPTAHLDIQTELELKQQMLPLMEGRLVFIATHRLHWLRDADLILLLEGGELVQSGSLEAITATPDSPLLHLAAQLGGERA